MVHRTSEADNKMSWPRNPPPPYVEDYPEDTAPNPTRRSEPQYDRRSGYGAYDNHDSNPFHSNSNGRNGREARETKDNGGRFWDRTNPSSQARLVFKRAKLSTRLTSLS